MNEAHSSVTLSAGDYTAEIGLRGGQLLRLTHGEDDLIVPASSGAAGYPGAVLAPWPNRVAEATYAHQDIVYDLEANEERTGAALHGLLTDVDLTVRAEHDDHTELAGIIEPTSGYPFRVEVVLFYRLSPATGLASTFMARYRPDEESTAGEADADSAESEEADVLEVEGAVAEDAAAEDAAVEDAVAEDASEDPVLEDAVVADESAVHLGHEDAAQAQDEPDSEAEPADAAEASAEAELNTEGNSSTEGDPELAADGEKADDAESAQDVEDSDDVEPLDGSKPSEDAELSEDAEAAADAEDSAGDSAEDGAAAAPAEAGPLTAPFGAGFHPYLTAAGAALHECRLRLPARTVLTTAVSGHVEGREAAAGDFDLSRGPLLGDRTIDHAYTDLPEEGWFAELSHGPTGFTVRMIADARWAQIYTGEAIDRAGVAVEPMSCPPDAFNSGEDLVQLAPGEWFRMGYSIEAIRDE